jgi:hypothetical protein
MIEIFKRKVWRKDPKTGRHVPHATRGRTIATVQTVDEARQICRDANQNRPPEGTAGYYNFVWTEFRDA